MRGALLRRAALLLVAALLGVGPAHAAPAGTSGTRGSCPPGLGIGLVDAVASMDDRGRVYVVDRVDAGTGFSRRVRVCNGTDAALRVQLHAGAAVVEDGAFRVVEGRAENELTGWVQLDPGTLTVPAGGHAVATARFSVPTDADDGERYGVLLAAVERTDTATGRRVAERVGVRVYLAVGDGDATTTDFTVSSLQAVREPDGTPVLRALVRNTGRRAIDPQGALELFDGPGETRAGPFPATTGTTVAPGEEAPVLVRLDPGLSRGPWRAELVLSAAGRERRSSATVVWPAGVGAAAPVPATPLEGHGRVLGLAVGLPLLVLLLLALVLVARRRSRAHGRPPVSGLPSAAPGVALPGAPLSASPAPAPAPVLAAPVPVPSAGAPGASAVDGRPAPAAGGPARAAALPVLPAPRSAAVRRALAARAGTGATDGAPRS